MKTDKIILILAIILGVGLSVSFGQKKSNKLTPISTERLSIIGNKFKADFGKYVYELHFESETKLTWKTLQGEDIGYSETADINKIEVRPNVYLVYWKEKSGTTVTHLEDFENEAVYTNIITPDQQFLNLKGKLTKMETISNKQKVVDLLKSLETGNDKPVSYINPNKYIQHNLAVADGLDGFKAFVSKRPPNSVKVNTVRVFQDGNYVFAHTEYQSSRTVIGFDIFRFENGKIVEHWDNLQEFTKPNPSGHTMIDGLTEIKDLEKTEANKTLVKNFVENILVNGKMDKLAGYFDGDNYIQHNPLVPNQLSGLGKALAEWSKQGITMKYNKIHQVLGEGNFVLVVSEGHLAGKHNSFYDLFRIENGKIAEHWDTIEEIPAKETWKNDNGKF